MMNKNEWEKVTMSKASSINYDNYIRIAFNKRGGDEFNIAIYIGKKIADKCALKEGDRVHLFYNKKNNLELLLMKCYIGDLGYLLKQIKYKKYSAYRILIPLKNLIFSSNQERIIHKISYNILDNGLLLFLKNKLVKRK